MKNERIFIAFGGNLPGPAGTPVATIAAARGLLRRQGVYLVAQSPLYESDPWGGVRQPVFVNGVWEARFCGSAPQLLGILLATERMLGRRRRIRWGPRVIDLDLLAFGGLKGQWPAPHALELPHPRLGDRAFVLLPLADIAFRVTLPGYAENVGRLAGRLAPAVRLGTRVMRRNAPG